MDSTLEAPSFSSLGLRRDLLEVLEEIGFESPTPIQTALIPVALEGKDCIGQAQTGTGKTAAFALPILQRLDSSLTTIQALILAPTRELSEQVHSEFRMLARKTKFTSVAIVGGRSIRAQLDALHRYPPVIVGTPGRVIDLIQRRALDFSHVRFVVLDEADRMLDIGFRKDIERILRSCASERQTLLLSATLPGPVERLAQRYMVDPIRIDMSVDQVVVETIQQYYCTVDEDQKFGLLVKLLAKERPAQAIVFCRTKRGAQRIYDRLKKRLPDVATIHGDLPQNKRDQVIRRLRDGRARLVVATDIVGRGIDISGISHIINYDIPQSSDDYVHRVGRTGRISSENEGRAFTFVTPQQGQELTRIEMLINTILEEYRIGDYSAFEARIVKTIAEDKFVEPVHAPDSEWDDIMADLK